MRSGYIFLLLYLLWGCFGLSSQKRHATCNSTATCSVQDPVSGFLQCVGLPASDTGQDHMQNLKEMLEAAMDVFTFMRSSASEVPLFRLKTALELNPKAEPLQNEALVEMWLKIKITPLLKSINRHFLACLSTKNFSCSTYQIVVKELSHHFSEMIPERQKWIYSFFMYPFLSREGVSGCVHPNESSEDWLMKNFGAFSVMARMNDFSKINMIFKGLEVLHLLSPEQKFELLRNPYVGGLSNDSLQLVFHSLMTEGPPDNYSGNQNWTAPGYHRPPQPPRPNYSPYLPSSPHSSFREVMRGIMMAVKPISSFVHDFVWFTKQRNVSEIRGSTMTQFLLNWTLAEMASIYKPKHSLPPLVDVETPEFDMTHMEDWYDRVVMPVLKRFSKDEQSLRSHHLRLAFHYMYQMDHHIDSEPPEIQDICSVTLDGNPCGMTNAVENVAHIMHCAAKTDLTMSEKNIMRLILELTERLNLLIQEFATANFTEVAYDFRNIIEEANSIRENLQDPNFITMWFYVKLRPLLPSIPRDVLLCLSNKNFSCPAYQTIVALLSKHMSYWGPNSEHHQNIYHNFIYRFMQRHNISDVCFSANNSTEWLLKNFGSFLHVAQVKDFYYLNPYFSGLDVLALLSPRQMAQMIILPLPTPPDKEVVINEVFDFLQESPRDRRLLDVLRAMVPLAIQENPPCATYKAIFERLQSIMVSVPPDLEPYIRAEVDRLIRNAPLDCVPENIRCQLNVINETDTCKGINSDELQSYLSTSLEVPCNFTLEEYACAHLPNFTSNQLASLLSCNLSGNSTHSIVLWKIMLTDHNAILDPALDILADKPITEIVPSAATILDVIGEIRLALLDDEQLRNSSIIAQWFSVRLRHFLPSASTGFLRCLSHRNMSCQSYQQILQVFKQNFNRSTEWQHMVILGDFITSFLSRPHSGPGCLAGYNSSTEWLMDNVGPFSQYLSLQEILQLNPEFNPLEALSLLTTLQRVQLLLLQLPALPEQNVIINTLFDHLTASPEEQKKIPEFLALLHEHLEAGFNRNLSCSAYKTLFARMDLALVKVPLDVASFITDSKVKLSELIPTGCIIYSDECIVTSSNETEICMGVNSTALQLHLDSDTLAGRFCDFAVEEFACASLLALTAQDLAMILKCNRSANSSGSTPIWKLLLSKTSHVLNESLDLLTNMMFDPRNPAASMILDAIGEVRLNSFPDAYVNDPDFINIWFNHRLRPFLPAVSPDFLSCLTTKDFTCNTYQEIVQTLSHVKPNMSIIVQTAVLTRFIKPFLTRNDTADPGCLSGSNSSTEWLMDNVGPFSQYLLLQEILQLNPEFNPLEALSLLTTLQRVQLLLLQLPTLPEQNVIINALFDHLTASPEEQKKIPEFLALLHEHLEAGFNRNFSCSAYKTLFARMDLAVVEVPLNVASFITDNKVKLSALIPTGCIIYSGECIVTSSNETEICMGVNSTALQLYLDSDTLEGRFCDFAVEEFACASLLALTAQDLAMILKCNRSANSSGSTPIWKLLLSKTSHVLNESLDLLTNMMFDPRNPAASMILNAIGEVRLNSFPDTYVNDPAFINIWFNHRLRPFLPAVSTDFLLCLTTKNLTCNTYQEIIQTLSHVKPNMSIIVQTAVLTRFIKPFLTHNDTADPGCLSGSNSSTEWLMDNVGPFSEYLSLQEILQLNPEFNPLDALSLLTTLQRVQLLLLQLPALPEQDVIINTLFDHLTASPEEQQKIPEFLALLHEHLEAGFNRNLSCSAYKTLFARMDLALVKVPLDVASFITDNKVKLSALIPTGCIIYSRECIVTSSNETEICMGVNSTALQLHLDSDTLAGRFCDFAVEEFACASLVALTAQDLAMILKCNRSANSNGSTPIWKLLLSKTSHVLNESLDLLTNMMFDPRNPAASIILDAIGEVRLNSFPDAYVNDPDFINIWFNHRLRPFLPAVSPDFLSCLTTKDFTCNTYQEIIQTLSHVKPNMSIIVQTAVLTRFIKPFLTRNDTADPSCSSHSNNSGEWLQQNLGAFSHLVLFSELQMLHSGFSAMEALPQLTVRQLADVASTPGQLTTPAQVAMVMEYVPDPFLHNFFDDFSPSILGHESDFEAPVRSAILQVVFDRANLSHSSVDDSVVLVWLRNRLQPLLVELSHLHVSPFFEILAGRSCSLEQEGVKDLNMHISSLSNVTQKEIHNHIVQALQEPVPLRCYVNDQSYYEFLQSWFMGFQLPKLTTFLSLMPEDRMEQLVNSMSPFDLGNYLRHTDIVDDDTKLCSIFSTYHLTPSFLEMETLPEGVRKPMLPCLWPMALSNTSRSEVNAWFDQRLHNYLPFLTKDLLTSNETYNASCVAFQKLVSVLGEFNYTDVDFVRQDVYDTITTFLNSATVPRCYDTSNPELNSTAWFADYIGPFFEFITLDDLLFTFGSAEFLQVFTVDLRNIAIFNQTVLPDNVTSYYTELLYTQDNNFNPILLPLQLRCFVPGMAFNQLSPEESMIILHNLTTLCTDLDPQVASALAHNFGNTIDASVIALLGSESTGISQGQIQTIKPEDLLLSLDILGNVSGWNEGQARAIILSLTSSGLLQISNISSLFMLGSLIIGVPTNTFININGSQLITASQNPVFLSHLMTAPPIIQQIFALQIISVDSDSDVIIENVPDSLATEIPPSLLLGLSSNKNIITKLNSKKWKHTQVELFFDVVAKESATTLIGTPNNLSSSLLQGFTCTSVRDFSELQINKLIKACRRSGNNKVNLVETQLTCMYNHIKNELDFTGFELYPQDVLLYYDYSLVPTASCKLYFEQLSEADFFIFSTVLSYKRDALFTNARNCLNIVSTSLTKNDISVLGNMCCILDSSYINTSDSSILDKLQHCSDLTADQAAAVETLLQSGNTPLGATSNWTKATLEELGNLPLFLTSNFYKIFNKKTKRSFLKDFLEELRKNGVGRQKLKNLKREIRLSNKNKAKRSVANECNVGEITQVTISDEAFPFDYDEINQFNCCLSAATVRNNLAGIMEKVDQDEYLKIILEKLREAYANHSAIPENQVSLLGPASRQATSADINMWTITLIDTLSSLMDPSNGPWDPNLAKEIISKYLVHDGNNLNTATLNAIGGENLCTLDASVLQSISPHNLGNATITISNCTLEKKQALFPIAREAFGVTTTRVTIPTTEYQLIKPYLGGAPLNYIQSLVNSNVNMDLETFTSLNPSAVLALTVNEVRGLLGTHLPDLKSYENQELVLAWVKSQRQSELDTLGVGLQGGKDDPTNSPNPTVTPSGSTVTSPASSSASGGHLRADIGVLFLILGVLIPSVHAGV
uniref:uncharacterized protein LOC131140343 isoform X1 n=1 Tax=Doryrhamphus excisus TaxID=161450 RepID=UPI0025AE43F8|nr:uncharacterized protein LOC131140343 isoform X1 [Doryrhamphus excisus]